MTAIMPTPGRTSWLASDEHRAWATAQAVGLLAFFRASVDAGGWLVELDDDGGPLPTGCPPATRPRQNLLTLTRVVHSYALGEMLGIPWYRRFWEFAATHLAHHTRGGWYPQLDVRNRRKEHPWYGKPDVYHALQACLLAILPPAASAVGAICAHRQL